MLKIEENKEIKDILFFKNEVRVDGFVEIFEEKDFFSSIDLMKFFKKKIFIGSTSNLVFINREYDGLVIKNSLKFLTWNKDEVEVGSGFLLDDFLELANKRGFYKIQSLSGIPGTIGAAVLGNVGAFGLEIKKFVKKVKLFDFEKKDFVYFDNDKLKFGYRDSYLKKNKEKFFVYSVFFDFSEEFEREMNLKYPDEYFNLRDFSKRFNWGNFKMEDLRKNVKETRKEIFPDPEKYPNLGSTFKNITLNENKLKGIIKEYPDIPFWKMKDGRYKIPTAYVFDKILGIKGHKFGNIEIDSEKPLFFKNIGQASGEELFNLCQKIKKDLREKTDLNLEEEIYFIN